MIDILLHTQSIVCVTVDSQVFRVLGMYNFAAQYSILTENTMSGLVKEHQ